MYTHSTKKLYKIKKGEKDKTIMCCHLFQGAVGILDPLKMLKETLQKSIMYIQMRVQLVPWKKVKVEITIWKTYSSKGN